MTDKLDKIPKEAKLVFKGQIFDVYQWEQELYDGTKKIFERLVRPDTAQVIAVVENKILIQEQEQPHRQKMVTLPGGRFEENEKPENAALRELEEETGYTSKNLKIWKFFQPQSKILFNVYIFIAKNCQKISEPKLDGGEKITNKLITFDEFVMLSEDPYLGQKELGYYLMRMRLHPEEKETFKKMLFSS